jgi:hypothetical protein
LTSSPGAPAMRPKKAVGDGTLEDAGTYETHGDEKRGSVVALAIASTDPDSAMSGAIDCADDSSDAPSAMMNAMDLISMKPRLRAK